jgi:hypothetical protein
MVEPFVLFAALCRCSSNQLSYRDVMLNREMMRRSRAWLLIAGSVFFLAAASATLLFKVASLPKAQVYFGVIFILRISKTWI